MEMPHVNGSKDFHRLSSAIDYVLSVYGKGSCDQKCLSQSAPVVTARNCSSGRWCCETPYLLHPGTEFGDDRQGPKAFAKNCSGLKCVIGEVRP